MTTVEEHVMTSVVGRRERTERLHILTRAKRRDVLIAWTSDYSASGSAVASGSVVAESDTGPAPLGMPTSDS